MYSKARGITILFLMVGTSVFWVNGILHAPTFQDINWQANLFFLSTLAYLVFFPKKELTVLLFLSLIFVFAIWVAGPPSFLQFTTLPTSFDAKDLILPLILTAALIAILIHRARILTTTVIILLLLAAWYFYGDFGLLTMIALLVIPVLLFLFSDIFFKSSKIFIDAPRKKRGKGTSEPVPGEKFKETEPYQKHTDDMDPQLSEFPGQEPTIKQQYGSEPVPQTLEEKIVREFQTFINPITLSVIRLILSLGKIIYWVLILGYLIVTIILISRQYTYELIAALLAFFLWIMILIFFYAFIKKSAE